jgi:hypothetical protein
MRADELISPVVIFRQGGNNLRIGNTLVWVVAAYAWCQKHRFTFFFPSARSTLGNVVKDNSALFDIPRCVRESSVFDGKLLDADRVVLVDRFLNRTILSASECIAAIGNNSPLVSILPGILGCITDSSRCSWSSAETIEFIASHRATIVNDPYPFSGHGLTDTALYESHVLTPSTAVESLLAEARGNGAITVGIHIRQTDYQRWDGGRHYRDNDFYNGLIDIIYQGLPKDSFLYVAHDGQFARSDSCRSSKLIQVSGGTPSEAARDFAKFIGCDYIVGPVSTFTAQAIRLRKLWLGKPCGLIRITPGSSLDDTARALLGRIEEDSL